MNHPGRLAGRAFMILVLAGVQAGIPLHAREEGNESAAVKKKPDADATGGASTKPMTAEERIAALEEIVRVLQARIQELDSHAAASTPANVTSAPGAAPAQAPPNALAAPMAAAQPPAPANAAPPAAPVGNVHSFFDKVTFSGLVDTYYGYNFNRPQSRTSSLYNFDVNHNQFSLNLLELAIERQPEPLGFRVDFDFGDTAKMVAASEPGGTSLYQFLQQAYITYKAPVGKGLTIDVGKFVTPFGAEVIESPANYNYSRSLLFSWAIPYYHFGTRLTYAVNDKVSLMGMVVNGWNDVVDNNGGKTVHLGVTLTPFKKLSIVQNYMVGAEQPGNDHDKRHVVDTTVTFSATDKLSLMANYDYGMDRVMGSREKYQGVAGYLRYAFSSRFAISPRLEWFTDPQGLATGFGQTLREGTFTSEFKVRQSMLLRAEYRTDWSNHDFFQKRSGILAHSQTTATLGIIYLMGQEP